MATVYPLYVPTHQDLQSIGRFTRLFSKQYPWLGWDRVEQACWDGVAQATESYGLPYGYMDLYRVTKELRATGYPNVPDVKKVPLPKVLAFVEKAADVGAIELPPPKERRNASFTSWCWFKMRAAVQKAARLYAREVPLVNRDGAVHEQVERVAV